MINVDKKKKKINILAKIISSLKDGARDAGCSGAIMRAEIKLTISGATVVVEMPIPVNKLPDKEPSK